MPLAFALKVGRLAPIPTDQMRRIHWSALVRCKSSKGTTISSATNPFRSRYWVSRTLSQTAALQKHPVTAMNIDHYITGIEAILGYNFNDKSICAESVQMVAAEALLCFEGREHKVAHNQRLELLGDRIIDAVLSRRWYYVHNGNGESSGHKPHLSALKQVD
jgi:hypothetical protein